MQGYSDESMCMYVNTNLYEQMRSLHIHIISTHILYRHVSESSMLAWSHKKYCRGIVVHQVSYVYSSITDMAKPHQWFVVSCWPYTSQFMKEQCMLLLGLLQPSSRIYNSDGDVRKHKEHTNLCDHAHIPLGFETLAVQNVFVVSCPY